MKNKKVVYTVIGIVSIVLIALAITYAYWQITKNQEGVNVISSACLDISLSNEQNDINLQSQYPITDEEGAELTPYTFTVTNNCDTEVDYQIALESMGTESTAISASSIKVKLNDDNANLLNEKPSLTTTVSGAYASHKLGMGTLAKSGEEGSSATHDVRLWIDESAPVSEANKTFTSKISVTVGQNTVNPIKDGMLAYNLVNAYGGINNITEISAGRYTEYLSGEISEHYNTATSSMTFGTKYVLDKETGRFTLAGELVTATIAECRNGQKTDGTEISCGKYSLSGITNIRAITSFYGDTADTSTRNYYKYQLIKAVGEGFAAVPTEDEYGMYKAGDDYGTSYYYRGGVINNYVQFGVYPEDTTMTYVNGYTGYGCDYERDEETGEETSTCTNEVTYDTEEACYEAVEGYYDYECNPVYVSAAGKPMYWRIVRINGDGTIRLIYDGVELAENGTEHVANIGAYIYNSNGDTKYVGYVYDESNTNSKIKDKVDAWYAENLNNKYSTYIADSIFCNDTEITETRGSYIYFGAFTRLVTYKKPKLTCSQSDDKLTVNSGKLTYPIGLITADEVMMAGYTAAKVTDNFIYGEEPFWTLSPSYTGLRIMSVGYNSLRDSDFIYSDYGVRPVINLNADVKYTGSGTITDPYVVITN